MLRCESSWDMLLILVVRVRQLTDTITALERERGHGQKRYGRVL